jgi:lactoylglutathione lyase
VQTADMTDIASLVVFAGDAVRTAAFCRAVGVPLETETHHEGPDHVAAELGAIHVAVYQAESPGRAAGRRDGGSTFAGFSVDSLDGVATALAELDATVLTGHERMPWGCRIVAADPDGRAVEINDHDHDHGHCDRSRASV